ncbi:uroporphyrinogen-III synthase [Ferrovibrio terrae]|uniref:Uroporphyrinogen-III synthase n=1 Tax=Ferrovibrio terrae TaxID=2594003 RepID=A0A516GZA2_9PROT|nr:uroporphyrinogen-III synthase [Ferrovibrio terrae]QDO96837.1 uroporphyrinogen-III synthase [Ferrovibrio terrae]
MQLLLTRPEAESQSLRDRLQAMGHVVDAAPMLAIRQKHDAGDGLRAALDGVTALLFTSANGVRAFADAEPQRDFIVYAVGPASALAAKAAGFTRVEAAGGDVDLLAQMVRARHSRAAGALLHAAGSARAGDLQAMLQQDGYDVRRAVLYDAETAIQLPPAVAARFAAKGYDGVLFFSPRTAATFVNLAQAAGIAGGAAVATAWCLSDNVAREASVLPWRDVKVAQSPGEADLVALLQ